MKDGDHGNYPGGTGVDADECMGYLEGGAPEEPPLGLAMGVRDPAGGEGGLPLSESTGKPKSNDEHLLEALRGVQTNMSRAIKILEQKVKEGN